MKAETYYVEGEYIDNGIIVVPENDVYRIAIFGDESTAKKACRKDQEPVIVYVGEALSTPHVWGIRSKVFRQMVMLRKEINDMVAMTRGLSQLLKSSSYRKYYDDDPEKWEEQSKQIAKISGLVEDLVGIDPFE